MKSLKTSHFLLTGSKEKLLTSLIALILSTLKDGSLKKSKKICKKILPYFTKLFSDEKNVDLHKEYSFIEKLQKSSSY